MKEEKVTKHKHKWESDYNECPSCGFCGQYFICECGEVRDSDKKEFN